QLARLSNIKSKADDKYIARYKAPDRQNASLTVRNLARYILSLETGIPELEWEFIVLPNNTRIAVSLSGLELYVSFSHSKNFGAVAISEAAIGIDIEEIKNRRPWKEMTEFLDLPLKNTAIQNQIEFLHHWTALEAKIKFRCASEKAIINHHYRPEKHTILCVASPYNASRKPEFIPLI
ncbi:MAG: hypothetical protein ABJL73_05780, partial [Lentilitoribacter sp.]